MVGSGWRACFAVHPHAHRTCVVCARPPARPPRRSGCCTYECALSLRSLMGHCLVATARQLCTNSPEAAKYIVVMASR